MQEENHVQSVDGNQNEDIPPTDLGEISFHAILGKEFSSTLKLQGTLCGHKVLMLVDSGLTHNFVAEEIVTKLGLVVQYIPTFGVQIGNGEIIKCSKVCHDLSERHGVGYTMVSIPQHNTSQLARAVPNLPIE
ncbi:hypothetical protein KY290_023055 [Solanum tuberosum]|uniref:Uncharacterized protein n=1 Tax=Solanum tuberosum TaxID=4113 RepID=A0ABQ7V8A3_SOLTU|nr:hypothetical protein KY290_023055 [Solanum tuberosum]